MLFKVCDMFFNQAAKIDVESSDESDHDCRYLIDEQEEEEDYSKCNEPGKLYTRTDN